MLCLRHVYVMSIFVSLLAIFAYAMSMLCLYYVYGMSMLCLCYVHVMSMPHLPPSNYGQERPGLESFLVIIDKRDRALPPT